MFGFVPFAKLPFTTYGSFFSGTIAEGTTLADVKVITAQFASSLTENTTLADSSTQASTFLQSIV